VVVALRNEYRIQGEHTGALQGSLYFITEVHHAQEVHEVTVLTLYTLLQNLGFFVNYGFTTDDQSTCVIIGYRVLLSLWLEEVGLLGVLLISIFWTLYILWRLWRLCYLLLDSYNLRSRGGPILVELGGRRLMPRLPLLLLIGLRLFGDEVPLVQVYALRRFLFECSQALRFGDVLLQFLIGELHHL
jgi:hypothetical protein